MLVHKHALGSGVDHSQVSHKDYARFGRYVYPDRTGRGESDIEIAERRFPPLWFADGVARRQRNSVEDKRLRLFQDRPGRAQLTPHAAGKTQAGSHGSLRQASSVLS